MSEKVTKIVILGTGRQAQLLYFGLELSEEPFDILGVYGEKEKNDVVFGLPVKGLDEITGLAGVEFDILFYCMETNEALQDMLGKAFGACRIRSWDGISEFLTGDQKDQWLNKLRSVSEEEPGYALSLGEVLGKAGYREEGYLYDLLAAALCQDQERIAAAQKADAVDTDSLDCNLLQKLLEAMVRRLIAAERYDSTFAFLGYLMFQPNKFLFAKILDRWVRYYYILLEIAICERNRGSVHTVMKEWTDWREFEMSLRQFKFAFRRIWFGFESEAQQLLVRLADRYQVSADFLAVLCKGAVHEDYAAAVMNRSAELFRDAGRTETASGLSHYATLFERMHPSGKLCMSGENQYHALKVVDIDAERDGVDCYAADQEHEIACILCANDEDYVKEMILYLKRQNMPEGYHLGMYIVRGAKSMTAGYELARKSIPAEIKIYMHQDTFIFDEEYLKNLIETLRSADYAMLGLAGTKKLPGSAIWGESDPDDMRFCLYQDFTLQVLEAVTDASAVSSQELSDMFTDEECQEVESIDGVLMATREDVPWREDLFKGFHFYDISQCMEYRRRGYRVGIFENGGCAGVLHEVNVSKNEAYERLYEEARRRFLQEYHEQT
ncbi:MAG: glycosyltransferase family protein [Lachnospiraceae bacterium]|nr:glycosyltransferase family protein [Lachnospiraceae bacterium]